MSLTRRARVRALAKINLDLRILEKRADGYHELRSIFQTISLSDLIEFEFTPARQTAVDLDDNAGIADNLVVRAARLVLDAMQRTGRLHMRLLKSIPMGAGLGGGSSDAAAVLLALPVLAGGPFSFEQQSAIASGLGSDINFFLTGGTAAAIGRGTELFPLPDMPPRSGILLAPGVHVSTAEAYRMLSPRLTAEARHNKINTFQSLVWSAGSGSVMNDFEAVVFEQHPKLAALKKRLIRSGASPAMMTGSGSALFGLYGSRTEAARALETFRKETSFAISFVSRSRYQSLWQRWLAPHTNGKLWPPRSRYAR